MMTFGNNVYLQTLCCCWVRSLSVLCPSSVCLSFSDLQQPPYPSPTLLRLAVTGAKPLLLIILTNPQFTLTGYFTEFIDDLALLTPGYQLETQSSRMTVLTFTLKDPASERPSINIKKSLFTSKVSTSVIQYRTTHIALYRRC